MDPKSGALLSEAGSLAASSTWDSSDLVGSIFEDSVSTVSALVDSDLTGSTFEGSNLGTMGDFVLDSLGSSFLSLSPNPIDANMLPILDLRLS